MTVKYLVGRLRGFIFLCAAPILLAAALVPASAATSCYPPPSGVIGWWTGDGTASDFFGAYNATLQGSAAASATGMVAQAFSFDGTNGYAEIPDAAAFHPTNLTIEAWVRFNSLDSAGLGECPAGEQFLVFKQNTRYGDFEGFDLNKTRISGVDVFKFMISSSEGRSVEIDSSAALATGVWYHVAAVRGSNFVQLYVNGQLQAGAAVTFPQDYGTMPLYFGTSGQSYWDRKLNGTLDEVTLYNRALSSTEIASIYAAGAAGKCKNVIGLTFTAQPQSQSVALSSNAVFSVGVSGSVPISYQWQFDGSAISGATNSSYTLFNAQTNNDGSYSVVVTNSTANVTSAPATLTVLNPPVITTQPLSVTNAVGATVTFTSAASGSGPLSYQWLRNSFSLSNTGRFSGVTSTTLTITNVQLSDAGSFNFVATNSVGLAVSSPAYLTVLAAPSISSQPGPLNLNVGSNANFSVTASGTAPLSYQWRFNGTNLVDGGEILGSLTSDLFVGAVQTTNAGSYTVVIANSVGAITSNPAMLTVSASGCASAPRGIVGWWTGDGNASDIVGPDNASLQGTATDTAAGEVNQCFGFDGTNAYVSIPDFTILHPTNFTIEAWVEFTSLDSPGSGAPVGDQYIIFKQNSRASQFEGFDLSKTRTSGGDVFRFMVTSSQGQTVLVESTTTITTNTWYHVAAMRGTNFIQLYVNGQSQAQATVTFPQDYGIQPMYFGTSGQPTFWDRRLAGKLDEVSLYERPLTGTEIASIYSAGPAGKCKGGVAPSIVTQPANEVMVPNGSATFSVYAVGTAPLSYQWWKDGFKLINDADLSGATNSSLTISNLQSGDIGNYQVIIANSFGSVTSIVASLNSGVPPANDNFSGAQAISGSSGNVAGNNANATKQPGEPNHAGNPGGASVWYAWTAPSTSAVTFDLALSAFDTLLAVYTGSSVSNLTLIASNDNATTNMTRSRLTFTPVKNTVYYIAVDGSGGVTGNFNLRWAQANVALPDLVIVASALNPTIDTETFDPSSCAVVEGLIQAGTRRVIRFDTETENQGNADLFFGDPSTNPLFVWAPCHAHYHFNNYMSYRLRDTSGNLVAVGLKVGFCVLDVFRWKSGAASTAYYNCSNQGIQVGWGDLYDHTLDGQWIDITGLPDGNYIIEIEPNPQGIIQESNYANNIIQVPITVGNPNAAPANDNFASAQTLLGGFASVSGTTANATKQSKEPNHAGNAGGHSVWYSWNAPDTKAVTIDTIGSSFNTLLAVYTGSTLASLSLVASNDDISVGDTQSRVTFTANAGTTYQIAVDGYNGASGNLILTLTQTIENDNFANPDFIGGPTGVAHGSNVGATKEPGEPNHAGNPGGASIWYAWTAPINGVATFDTIGSTFNTLLAAYTGGSVSLLTPIASNDDIDPANNILTSRITFNAVGLSRYYIAIDGYNGATGDTTLNWNLQSGAAGLVVQQPLASRATVINSFLPSGEFQLLINGQPDQRYLIERSCDLVTWTPLVTTLANDSGAAYFVDKSTMHLDRQSTDPLCGSTQPSGSAYAPGSMRFYRATAIGVFVGP